MKQFIGQEVEVLFEKHHDGEYVSGYTSNYLRVQKYKFFR